MNGLVLKIKQILRDRKKADIILYGVIIGVFLIVLSATFRMPNTSKSNPSESQENDQNPTMEAPLGSSNNNTVLTGNSDLLTMQEYEIWLEQRLSTILSQVAGIGKVEVMITLKSSKEVILSQNSAKEESITNETDSNGGQRISQSTLQQDTVVIITDQNGSERVYVTKEYMPEIEGVLVIAQGVDAQMTLEINAAILALFDVEVHKIKVLEMRAE